MKTELQSNITQLKTGVQINITLLKIENKILRNNISQLKTEMKADRTKLENKVAGVKQVVEDMNATLSNLLSIIKGLHHVAISFSISKF